MSRDYSPYQQKIIKRYYNNQGSILLQRFSELITELYLAETAKKQERLWTQISETLGKLEFPASRIEHLMQKRDPALLPGVLQELQK